VGQKHWHYNYVVCDDYIIDNDADVADIHNVVAGAVMSLEENMLPIVDIYHAEWWMKTSK